MRGSSPGTDLWLCFKSADIHQLHSQAAARQTVAFPFTPPSVVLLLCTICSQNILASTLKTIFFFILAAGKHVTASNAKTRDWFRHRQICYCLITAGGLLWESLSACCYISDVPSRTYDLMVRTKVWQFLRPVVHVTRLNKPSVARTHVHVYTHIQTHTFIVH